ncbi:MAG: DNA polymerase III subunit alpha, partial [Verrucomicrobia bacterium]|nr:DNA polymerase III subunit alpha [Verrucomicrobiota bacterium]
QLLYGILQLERKEGGVQLSCRYLDDLAHVDEMRIKACDEAYDRLKAASRKTPEPKWKTKEKGPAKVEKEEPKKVTIQLDADRVRLSEILAMKNLFRSHPGKSTLEIHFSTAKRRVGTVLIDAPWGVQADREFQEKLRALIGDQFHVS